MALSNSVSPMLKPASNIKFLVVRQRCCERVLDNMDMGLLDFRAKLNTLLAMMFHYSVDGEGVVSPAQSLASSRWVESDSVITSGVILSTFSE